MRRLIPLATIAFVAVLSGAAEAKQFHFDGPHPVDAQYGGGFCYIEGPHIHIYDAKDPDALYRVHGDDYVFVGDPVAHGYEGPKNAFYGPHPIPGGEWCYLEGPHYHVYAAPPEHFKVKDGVYFYVGDMPQVYVEAKPKYSRINQIYRPMKYARPVYVEAPPVEYHGPVVEIEPPSATVVVPSVQPSVVVAPAPGAVIVGGPQVGAGIDFHAGISVGIPTPVIVAPQPGVIVVHDHEQPGVVVVHDHGPPPPVVVVHDHAPAPVVVVHDHDDHHDNGKHNGDHH